MRTTHFAFVLFAFALLAPGDTSAQTMCTMEYAPVCASKEVQCITAPCLPVQQTYGNACTARADDATIIHTGECGAAQSGLGEAPIEPYIPPRACTAWYDGCNSCALGTDGQAICTLRYCEKPDAGYCTVYETRKPVGTSTGALAPATGTIATSSTSLSQGISLWSSFFASLARLFVWVPPFWTFR